MVSDRLYTALLLSALLVLSTTPARAQGSGDYPSLFDPGAMRDPPPPKPPASPPPEEPRVVEPPSAPFGAPGEVVFSGASSLDASYRWYESSLARSGAVSFSPGLDVFVARNVTVGGGITVSYADFRGYGADSSLVETSTTTLSAGPRFGYNVALGSALSWLPRVTIGFEWSRQQEQVVSGASASIVASALGYPTTTRTGPWLSLDLPLLWHVAPHAFLGFGPTFFQEFGPAQGGPDVGGQRTSVGASFLVGGWTGGRAPIPPVPADPPARTAKAFGSAGQVLLTSEFGLAGSWLRYEGSGSSQTQLSASPAIDYFIGDHVSAGLGFNASTVSSSGVDPTTGSKVDYQSTSGSVVLRFGVDLPLGRWLSFYPRAYFGAGAGSIDESSAGAENKSSQTFAWAALYAPLLVHPASHFFAGFGPSITRDLARQVSFPSGASEQNLGTTIGVGLLVGAWL